MVKFRIKHERTNPQLSLVSNMTKQKLNQLHFRRLEFKYVVPTHIIDLIVPTISRYLIPDNYAKADGFYTVNSLYFDSPNLICYQQKLDGVLARKKYRLRYYNDKKKLFFEIKRKIGDTVYKDRIIVPQGIELGSQIFENQRLFDDIPASKFKAELQGDFHRLRLNPKVLISYRRRPYVSKYSRDLRITLDYDLKETKISNGSFQDLVTHRYVSSSLAVLEIKFNESLPAWVGHIIKLHDLERTSFSKYASAIEQLLGD